MTGDSGWRPLQKPVRRVGAEGFVVTPFMRFARVHAASTASDAAIAVALAGSIFFSISPDESRARVALYLVLTMAPFAVVTPLIGPAIDRVRGGRRLMIVLTTLGRATLAFLLARHVHTLWLFPEAFGFLVLQKGYAVAKSAVVPALVPDDEALVGANSKLALISAVMSMVGAAVGGLFSLVGGPAGAAVAAMAGFAVATTLALRLPRLVVASGPPAELEKAELRDPTIVLGALAMAVLRGIVGFVTFLVAFEFRGGKEGLDISAPGAALGGATATVRGIDIVGDPAAPAWHFGVVVAAAGLGAVTGARLAPALRSRLREESMLLGVLGALIVLALFSAALGGLLGAVALALGVATAAGAGKLAFESLVQRDAPDANHGRSFARFEARFQIAWVIGAFVPAVLHLGAVVGAWMVAIASLVALTLSLLGRQADRRLHATSVNRWLTGEATVSGAVLARLRQRWGAPGPPVESSLPPPVGTGPDPRLSSWGPPTVPVGDGVAEPPTVPVGDGVAEPPTVPVGDGVVEPPLPVDGGGGAPALPVEPTIWAGDGVEIDDEPA